VGFDVACLVATRWNAEAAVHYIKSVQSVTLWAKTGLRHLCRLVQQPQLPPMQYFRLAMGWVAIVAFSIAMC
jgi:hypothetical protein